MAVFTALTMWATAALGPGALSIAGLSPALTAAVVKAGQSALWSITAQALSRPQIPLQQIQATIQQTDLPRVRAYGRNMLGGTRAFWETDDGKLYQLVVLHHGAISGLISFWVDSERVQVDAGGNVTTSPISPDMQILFRDGTAQGGSYAVLQEAFPSLWTAQHQLQGQATLLAVMYNPGPEQFAEVFPKGPQTLIQAEVQGALVRSLTGTMVYTESPGLCIRDYLTHADGWRIPLAALDTAGWQAFVGLCAEPVALKAGGTEPRYSLCGHYTLDDAPKDVAARMLATCDGQVYQTAEGKVSILGGRWSVPDVTITSADILSISAEDGFDPFTDFNILKGSCVSPAHKYQPTEVKEIRDNVALSDQPERVEQLDVDMCPSTSQMQRLLKIRWAKARSEFRGKLTTNLVGMKARFPKGDGLHTIRVDAPEFGISGIYEVESHSFDVPSRTCEIGIASIVNPYGWTVAEEADPPRRGDEIGKPARVPLVPAGASLTQVPVLISGDTYGGKLRLTVNSVIRKDLFLEAQVAQGDVAADAGGATRWTAMGGDRFSAETGILQNEQAYTVRYRWRRQAAWQKAGTLTIVANPNVPAAPTEFQRIGSSGVEMTWRNPSDNFWKARIFRSQTNSFAGAAQVLDIGGTPGLVSTFRGSQATGTTWFYWVVALNGSSVASPPAGPISISS